MIHSMCSDVRHQPHQRYDMAWCSRTSDTIWHGAWWHWPMMRCMRWVRMRCAVDEVAKIIARPGRAGAGAAVGRKFSHSLSSILQLLSYIHVLDPIRDFAESITIMSSAAASSSSTTADGAAAAAAKRKTTTTNDDDDSALPPDKAKNASLQRLVKQLNATIKAKKDQYTIVQLNDSPLRLIPGREDKILDEYEVECLSDLSSDQLNEIYNKLTQEEVDNYIHLMVVRESTVNLFEKQIKSIQVRSLTE